MNLNEERVLELIRENPYISQKEMGQKLNLTRSTIATIVSNLTQKKLIKGRAYILNEDSADVIVIGAINVDRKYVLEETLELKTSNPAYSETFVGGVGRNVAENLGRLGHKVYIISVAGYDQDYEFIKKESSSYIDFSHVKQINDYATGSYSAILNTRGEMELAIADMAIYDLMDLDFIRGYSHILSTTKLLIIDLNLPRETIEYLIEFCRSNKIKLVVVPVSSPKIKRLPDNLSGVSYLIVNKDESEKFFDIKADNEEEFINLAKKWIDKGVEEVVITRGRDSSVYYNKNKVLGELLPPALNNVVDVTGAGDSFSAGIIHGFLSKLDYKTTLELALTNSYHTIQSKNTVRHNLSRDNLENERIKLKEKGLL